MRFLAACFVILAVSAQTVVIRPSAPGGSSVVSPVSSGGTAVIGAASAFTYYVDSGTDGSDSNPGTFALPWKTIAKVNAMTLVAGQGVGFKSGGVWRETLTPGQSGTAGKPITFGAYGTGAKPRITGADLVTSWTVADAVSPTLSVSMSSSLTPEAGTGTFTFSRASSASYVHPATGLISTAATNAPRFERVAVGKTAMLWEPAGTNLTQNSSIGSGWNATAATITAATTGPDGANSAYGIIPTIANSAHSVSPAAYAAVSANGKYVLSAYLKSGSSHWAQIAIDWITAGFGYISTSYVWVCTDRYLDPASAAITSGGIDAIYQDTAQANGWLSSNMYGGFVRAGFAATAPATAAYANITVFATPSNGVNSFVGDGTTAYTYVSGVQLETGRTPTSLIYTSGGTATRATDVLSYPTSGNFSQAAGTAFLEWAPTRGYLDSSGAGVIIGDGSSADVMYPVSGNIYTSDFTTSCNAALNWAAGTNYQMAARWVAAGNKQVWANGTGGGACAYDGGFAAGATLNVLTGNSVGAHISNLRIYASSLSDAQIKALSYGATWTATLATVPGNVYVDGAVLLPAATQSACNLTPGSWFYTGTTLYVHTGDGLTPATHTVEAAVRSYGASVATNYISIDGLSIDRVKGSGIYGNLASSLQVRNSAISGYADRGIWVNGDTAGSTQALAPVIINNTVGAADSPPNRSADYAGILLRGTDAGVIRGNTIQTGNIMAIVVNRGLSQVAGAASTGFLIQGNTITGSEGNIALMATSGGKVTGNTISNGNGQGIGCWYSSHDIEISYNLIYALGMTRNLMGSYFFNGVDTNSGSYNLSIVHNTVYGVWGYSLSLETSGTSVHDSSIRNNILHARANVPIFGSPAPVVVYTGTSNLTFASNDYYPQQFTPTIVGVTDTTTLQALAGWNSATGDTGSVGTDPLFTDAAGGDFTLQPGSPAIGTGVYIAGVSTSNPPNIGAK